MRMAVTVRTALLSEYTAVGLFKSVKAAVLFGCVLFTSQVFAVDYYWVYNGGSDGLPRHTSAMAACPKSVGPYQEQPTTLAFVKPTSTGGGFCSYSFGKNGGIYTGGPVNRFGSTCPTGSVIDPVNGQSCVSTLKPGEKCADQTGATAQNPFIWDAKSNKCEKFFDAGQEASCKYLGSAGYGPAAYTVAGNLDSGGNAVAPPTFTSGTMDCQAKTVSSSECTIDVAGAISCNVMATFTGEVNGGNKNTADALCPDGKCPVKEPQTKTTEEGCSPVGDGAGGSSCTQTKETVQEGTQQCGQVNGSYTCVTKKPYSNGINTSIKSTSQTLPDGSVKVTTVKDSSNTVCNDVKNCTTSKSTTTNITTTKPNGATSTQNSCTGACTPNGGGVETNPTAGAGNSGGGSGGGGTGGNGDGEEEGGGTAGTTDKCDATPACDGDPFLCAILKQDHIDTCKLMADATAEQKSSADAKTAAAYAQLDAHQVKLDSDVNGLLSKFQTESSSGGSGGAKCLQDKKFSVAGHSLDIPFSQVCDSLGWLRLVVLAGAYLFAARIVSKEV